MEAKSEALSGYRELIAWQKSIALVTEIYSLTRAFPREETYGLAAQMRRCAVSIPSNIAEGQGRSTRGEFVLFLSPARGSLFELETQLLIAGKLDYLKPELAEHLACKTAEVARILNGLLTSLGVSSRKPAR